MSYLDENVAKSERSFDEYSQAPSVTPVHSVHNGLNPQWNNPYATGVIRPVMNDAASLSSLPMSPTFSYTSLPNMFPSTFVYSTSNMSHRSTSTDGRNSDLLPSVDVLNHQYSRLNHLLKSEPEKSEGKCDRKTLSAVNDLGMEERALVNAQNNEAIQNEQFSARETLSNNELVSAEPRERRDRVIWKSHCSESNKLCSLCLSRFGGLLWFSFGFIYLADWFGN